MPFAFSSIFKVILLPFLPKYALIELYYALLFIDDLVTREPFEATLVGTTDGSVSPFSDAAFVVVVVAVEVELLVFYFFKTMSESSYYSD